jgi:hypothetical protein
MYSTLAYGLFLFLTACSLDVLSARSSKSTSSNPGEDVCAAGAHCQTPKPTEETEGVPGYLVNISSLSAEVDSSSIRILGRPGSVAASDGQATQKVVPKAWAVSLRRSAVVEEFNSQELGIELGDTSAVLLGKTEANDDGSFVLEVPVIDVTKDILVLSVHSRLDKLVIAPTDDCIEPPLAQI